MNEPTSPKKAGPKKSDSWLALIASIVVLGLFIYSQRLLHDVFEELEVEMSEFSRFCFSSLAIAFPAGIVILLLVNAFFWNNSKVINTLAMGLLFLLLIAYFFAVFLPISNSLSDVLG